MRETTAVRTGDRAELADVRRFGRRIIRRFVHAAREDEQPRFSTIISEHLGTDADDLDVVEETWPTYDHVNVQAGLDAWLGAAGRTHQLVGMVNFRHYDFGLADLLLARVGEHHGVPTPGPVARVNRATGPHGASLACIRAGVYLVRQGDDRLVMLFRDSEPHSDQTRVTLQLVANRAEAATVTARQIREAAVEHNVHRGQVLSFTGSMYDDRGSLLAFRARPEVSAEQLILPDDTFADIERQVVGVARHRRGLRDAGQHLKRGLLMYGPPGVGKTHTVRYLMSELRDTTIIELSGGALPLISEACSVARTLQPSLIVVEDVDLIAESRDHYDGQSPLLFTLLNEMDGLDEDADVVFLLTTNRADLLEPALAARPGRVDQAVEIGVPGPAARRRLFDLYRGRLDVDTSRIEGVLARTEGVTASFLKELLRRAAVVAAGHLPDGHTIAVTADDLDAALDELLHTRNTMTRVALGAAPPGLAPDLPPAY